MSPIRRVKAISLSLAFACMMAIGMGGAAWADSSQRESDLILREIVIVGNTAVDDEEIIAAMQRNSVGRPFDEDGLHEDAQAILDLGWFSWIGQAEVAELPGGGLRLSFYVEEFPAITDIVIRSDAPVESFVLERLEARSGEILNVNRMLESLYETVDEFIPSEIGYVLAVEDVAIDENDRLLIDLLALRVGAVEFKGNEKTLPHVIEREIRVAPGDLFYWPDVGADRRRLIQLGFFQDVLPEVEFIPGTADQVKVTYRVEERRTGLFSFGAGYSPGDGFVGFVDVSEENFFGRGQRVNVRWEFGRRKMTYDLGFFDPYFTGRPVSFGVNLYNRHQRDDAAEETAQTYGGDLTLGRPLGEFTRGFVTLRVEDQRIRTLDGALKDFERTRSLTLSSVTDTTDHPFNPTVGYRLRLSGEFAGSFLGGDSDFSKYRGEVSRYLGFGGGRHVLAGRLVAGTITGSAPALEQFRVGGGESVRGHAHGSMRGSRMTYGNLEYRFRIFESLQGVLFFDAGQAWKTAADVNFADLKTGYGLGVRLDTPIGMIRLDYGFSGETGKGQFYFNLGPSF